MSVLVESTIVVDPSWDRAQVATASGLDRSGRPAPGSAGVVGESVSLEGSAGAVVWTTDASALDHCQTSEPFRTTSYSPVPSTSASRAWVGSAYHTRHVCEPDSSVTGFNAPADIEPPPASAPAGSSGRPRSILWTTVPLSGVGRAFARSTSRSWADRCARSLWPPALLCAVATPPTTSAAARTGAAHRARGCWSKKDMV